MRFVIMFVVFYVLHLYVFKHSAAAMDIEPLRAEPKKRLDESRVSQLKISLGAWHRSSRAVFQGSFQVIQG